MRYIDADKLVEMYERSAEDDWNKKTAPSSWAEAFECAIADIDDQPTADVVPKSEVEIWKETADKCEEAYEAWRRTAELNAQRIMELEAEKEALIKNYAECMKDYAREIFEEIEKYIAYRRCGNGLIDDWIEDDIAELKKKYTEGEQRND